MKLYNFVSVPVVSTGKVFTNQETFGQYPLQISGYEDLHESIEASMSHREIETVNHTSEKSAQEVCVILGRRATVAEQASLWGAQPDLGFARAQRPI